MPRPLGPHPFGRGTITKQKGCKTMPAAKMETAADRYRRIKAERLKEVKLFDLTTPSGMEWKLRRPDLAQFVANGIMPIELALKVAEQQQQKASSESIAESLDANEQVKSVKFMADLVRFCAVSPRIVEKPTPGADEIGFAEVEIDDFYAIVQWAKGGGEAESLSPFPV